MSRLKTLTTSCVLAAVVATTLTACKGHEPEADGADGDLNVLVANYDLSQERPQRFLVGLVTDDQQLVSFGKASLSFGYLGKGDPSKATAKAEPGPKATASWAPIPGQNLKSVPSEPRIVDGSDGTGIYIAPNVRFDKEGYWQVTVEVDVDGDTKRGEAAFGVNPTANIIDIGDPAPASDNALPGAADFPVKGVDSRSTESGEVPDPELHRLTVADALKTGKPTVVVVSTPVYCISRFCGPVTDLASKLSATYGKRVNFIHIEVWRDFEKKTINKAAADWMYRPGTEDAFEPWVWLVGANGVVTHRWDNVTTEQELTAAVAAAA